MQEKRGFTLVEILIVVVILGILAAIVIPQFTEASTEAKTSSLCTDLQTVRSQIELYKVQHNDLLPGETNPAAQRFLVRKRLQDSAVGGRNVVRVSRQGRPAERSRPLAEQRPDELRHEARDLEGLAHAPMVRDLARKKLAVGANKADGWLKLAVIPVTEATAALI